MGENRMPPQNIEAEKSVLGAMLIKKEAIIYVQEILSPEDFYREAHKVAYEAMLKLTNNEEAVDIVTLTEELRKEGHLEKIGGVRFVTDIAYTVPTAANISYHAKIVKEKAELRRLIDAATAIATAAYEDTDEVANIMDEAEKRILAVAAGQKTSGFESMKAILLRTFERINSLYESKGNITGISTGFKDLDAITSGLHPSDLVLVAARPSMGKTAFTLNIASFIGLHNLGTVAFFSLEMSKEQLMQRMLCSEGGIDAQRLRTGKLEDDEWTRLVETSNRLNQSPIYIDDTAGITVMELRSKARRLKAERGLSIIFIDYLQLMQGRGAKNSDSRNQEISDISRSLKALARELDVPVIALAQLNRSVENRQVRRPMLSDLRDSGSLEQDADIVMFLYREDYYDRDTEAKNITEVIIATNSIIAKHRNGPVDTVKLYFQKEFTKFRDLLIE